MGPQVVPFIDLKRQLAPLREEIDRAIHRVLDSGWYILGPEVDAFECELAAFLDCRFSIGVANGTEAIAIALMAGGVGAGHEVITSDLTAFPTVTGIAMSGATPVVADIDPTTGLLDTADVASKITPDTRALVPVHLYGQCCDMTSLLDIARRHELMLVEDCAQAIGARWLDKPSGTIGDVGCLSFYPTKNLGAMGDAGAVVTNSEDIASRARMLRNYGQTDRYHHVLPGFNSRMSELQAAVLRVKLGHVKDWNRRRQVIAGAYRRGLRGVESIRTDERGEAVWHLFPVLARDRAGFMTAMSERGVQTLIHYPVPVSRQPAFHGRRPSPSPHSDLFAARVVSLPIYPELSDREVDLVIAAANENASIARAEGLSSA